MKSAVETLNPTRVKLTVEVPFDELKPSLDAAYQSISKQVTVPGFRKGHVPPRIIDQRIGRGAVIEEAVNEALPRFYAQAVEESDVRPLGQPTVDVTEVPDPAKGGELKFTAEVDVRPEVELPELEGIAVTVDAVEVSDADVDERLDNLRERFGTLVTVERAAQTGDFVSLDISATIDDEEIDTVSGVSYEVGSGTMLEGMDEAVTGLQAGEQTTFTAPLAGGDRAGQEAEVTVTVQSVKERELPAPDDEFAQLASEFDTLDELRDDLRQQVAQTKKVEQGLQARERLLERLVETVDVPVPEGIVADEVHRHLEGEDRLQDDEHRAEVDAEARKAFKQQLLLDARRREGAGAGRPERADRLHRRQRAAVRHGPERVREGGRRGRAGAGHGLRGGPPQGARRGAREGGRDGRVGQPGRPLRALQGRGRRRGAARGRGRGGRRRRAGGVRRFGCRGPGGLRPDGPADHRGGRLRAGRRQGLNPLQPPRHGRRTPAGCAVRGVSWCHVHHGEWREGPAP